MEGLDLGIDALLALCVRETSSLVLERLCLPVLRLIAGRERRVLADRRIRVRVDLLHILSADAVREVRRELLLETLVVFLLQRLHVLRNVTAVDVLLEGLGVELLRLHVKAREALFRVRDEDTAVGRALHRTEDTVTGSSAAETDVQEALEGARRIVVVQRLGEDKLTSGFGDTLVFLVKTKLGESAARTEETSSIGYCNTPQYTNINIKFKQNPPAVQFVRPWLIP